MTHGQVSLTRNQDCQEDRGAEADVVEGVGELGDEVDPDQAVFRPGPSEHFKEETLKKRIFGKEMNLLQRRFADCITFCLHRQVI